MRACMSRACAVSGEARSPSSLPDHGGSPTPPRTQSNPTTYAIQRYPGSAEAGQHLVVEQAIGGHRVATPRSGSSIQRGESAAGLGHDGHERGHVVDLQGPLYGYVDGTFGD